MLIDESSIRNSLQPPSRYLITLLILANAAIVGSILGFYGIWDLKDFLRTTFLVCLVLNPIVTAGYFLMCKVHGLLMKRFVFKINQAHQAGTTLKFVTVTPETTLARLGLSAVRPAHDADGKNYSVISFESGDSTYKAVIWPLPSLLSYFGAFKQIYIAVPV